MSRLALVLLGGLLAALGGCVSGRSSAARFALDDDGRGHAPAMGALASLPEAAGSVIAVQTPRTGSGVTQRIVLQGDGTTVGENAIEVESTPAPAFATASAKPLRVEQIEADLASRFPGVTMRIAAEPVESAAGPLGVATGRTGASTCLYGWRSPQPTEAGGLLTVRVRLCRSLRLARLLALVRGLRVRGMMASGSDAEVPGFGRRDLLSSDLVHDDPDRTRRLQDAADEPSFAAPMNEVRRPRDARRRQVRRSRTVAHRQPPATDRTNEARGIAIPLPASPSANHVAEPAPSGLADLPMPPATTGASP